MEMLSVVSGILCYSIFCWFLLCQWKCTSTQIEGSHVFFLWIP